MVRCHLCSHHCRIVEGKRGIRVRENRGGTLYSLVYGKLVSSRVYPVETKSLFHFLPGFSAYSIATVGCNCARVTTSSFSIMNSKIKLSFIRIFKYAISRDMRIFRSNRCLVTYESTHNLAGLLSYTSHGGTYRHARALTLSLDVMHELYECCVVNERLLAWRL